MDATGTALVASVRLRAMLGRSSETTFTDSEILDVLNEETAAYMAPIIIGMDEERLVVVSDTTTVSGTSAYSVPAAALAGDLRDLQVPRDSCNPRPRYYMQGDSFVLVPTPTSVYTIRRKYWRRPDDVVLTGFSAASAIVGPGGGNYDVTVESTVGMTTGLFNFLDPSTYEVLEESVPGTVYDATTIRFVVADLTAAQIDALTSAVDDLAIFVNFGKSPASQLPPDTLPLLVRQVVVTLLDSIDDPRLASKVRLRDEAKQAAIKMMQPRTRGLSRKVVRRGGPGWTRWNTQGSGGGDSAFVSIQRIEPERASDYWNG